MLGTPMEDLIKFCKGTGCSFLEQEPLSQHTSFRIGGPAALFLQPAETGRIPELIEAVRASGLPWTIIGNGSNILAQDEGFPGVVLQIGSKFASITLEGETAIRCQAGAPLAALSRFAAEHSLTGLEFACGIPGAVGGAVFMNAGAYGGEISQKLVSVAQVTVPKKGKAFLETVSAQDLEFSYRHSKYQKENTQEVAVIAEAVFCLEKGDKEASLGRMEELLKLRREKQPLEFPSAGSAFKRPEGSYASLLIDQCGLKGLRVGDAQISEKHAGFIVNLEAASCREVLELAAQVQKTVWEKTGFHLEPEFRMLAPVAI